MKIMEKFELLDHVKKESKKLMECAVTKKFIHSDSSAVTAFCYAIDNCVLHKLKKRVGGLLPSISCSDEIIMKLSKVCASSEMIMQLSANLNRTKGRLISSNTDTDLNSPERKRLSGYSITPFSTKLLWIRLALVEKVLPAIIQTLLENWREFYEPESIMADQVHGPSLVWLLDGPCSLDYSKMKTPECNWIDPSANELVQRHRIYSSPNMSHNLKTSLQNRKRLFTLCSATNQPSLNGIPSLAREHVDSLHQNAIATLLFGKNNVELSIVDSPIPVHGYLSLHKSLESLLLKWTPNPMLCTSDGPTSVPVTGEKSKYWDQVLTIDFNDIVYLHCHHAGEAGGNIVLISQDGVQLPPLSFPSGGSLLSFLTCLEQGLMPEGRLDPPLIYKNNSTINWPKLKRNILPDKLTYHFEDKNNTEVAQDYVFRIIFMSYGIDKSELRKLLSTSNNPIASPAKLHTNPKHKIRHDSNHNGSISRKSLSTLHATKRLSRSEKPQSRIALNLACEKMKHQLVSRAFQGWLSSYRHLKTVRTHLALLVLPSNNTDDEDLQAEQYENGLTQVLWNNMKNEGFRRYREEIMKYVYYGGVEHSIRKEVWPFLLEHYSFVSSPHHINEVEKHSAHCYYQLLDECKAIEEVLQEKEKDLLALNGFANGERFNQSRVEHVENDMPLKNVDYTDNCNNPLSETFSRELSLSSDLLSSHSTLESVGNDSGNATAEFSIITSLLETKESLRDMVENASQKGASAWRNLLKKNKQKPSSVKKEKKIDIEEQLESTTNEFTGLHRRFEPSESFDLEYDCQSCGKKIIESSRYSSINSKNNSTDFEIDVIECFACTHERKNKQNTEFDEPDIPKLIPAVVYDRENEGTDNSDYVLINGEGTHLKKRASTSSATSSYSEDILKDYAMNIHRIDKDVLRCDRNHPYFVQEKNLEKLRNVMMCYVWERLNVGYIQGMCDLCAPLLVIMDDEAKVFNCFVKLMDKMQNNFPHGTAMDMHLSNISSLLQILDPELSELLQVDSDSTIFYFCYRWFLLDFKREMQYEDIFLVWETIWAAASVSSEHFNLFVALALIELYREIIIDNRMDFTDIIKFFNEMAEQHDARATLNLARNIVHKLQDVMHVPDNEITHA